MNTIIDSLSTFIRWIPRLYVIYILVLLVGERVVWFQRAYNEAVDAVDYDEFMCKFCEEPRHIRLMGPKHSTSICPSSCFAAERPDNPWRYGLEHVLNNTYTCVDIPCLDVPKRIFGDWRGVLVACLLIYGSRYWLMNIFYDMFIKPRLIRRRVKSTKDDPDLDMDEFGNQFVPEIVTCVPSVDRKKSE